MHNASDVCGIIAPIEHIIAINKIRYVFVINLDTKNYSKTVMDLLVHV